MLHLVNHVTINSRLVDADLENNLPTWYSSFHFSAAAVTALVVVGHSVGARRLHWLALAALCLAFSVDETASLHEVAGRELGAETTLSLTQPVAAAVVVGLLLLVARSTRGHAAQALVAAAVVLVASQTCASVAGLFTDGWMLFLLEAVEDSTETLAAILLLIAGLLAAGVPLQWRLRAIVGELVAWWRGTPSDVIPAISLADRARQQPSPKAAMSANHPRYHAE